MSVQFVVIKTLSEQALLLVLKSVGSDPVFRAVRIHIRCYIW